MKSRLIQFSLGMAALAVIAGTLSNSAYSQGGGVKNQIWLQSVTPGVSQSGHGNLSGTMRAGQFVGSGSGLSNLPAANLVGTLPVAAFPVPLSLSGTVSGSGVITGTNSSTAIASSGLRGVSNAATGVNYGAIGISSSTSGRGIYGSASAGSGLTYGVYGSSLSASGFGVFGNNSSGNGVGGDSISGIGVMGTSSSGTGVFGSTSSSYGVYGEATATTGSNYGVYGISESASGYGVYGRASSSSGSTAAVYGLGQSSTGYGVNGVSPNIGVRGTASLSTGIGVYGSGAGYGIRGVLLGSGAAQAGVYGSANTSGSQSAGILGESDNPDSYGVYGFNTATVGGLALGVLARGGLALEAQGITFGSRSTGTNIGAMGESGRTSSGATGVRGSSHNENGIGVLGVMGEFVEGVGTYVGVNGVITRGTDRGVVGDSDATTGTPYGVFGDTDGAGWAVYASGNSGASGTKSFRIDHPEDPDNKYLLHYSSESPQPMNFYSGNVITAENGYAWVDLPSYFATINTDFRYQLTVVDETGEFTQAIVSKKIKGNRFQIRTSQPRTEVSWRVEAVRNDAYVRYYGAPEVMEKNEVERGTFEHPELYGLNKERSFLHDRPSRKLQLKQLGNVDMQLGVTSKSRSGPKRKG